MPNWVSNVLQISHPNKAKLREIAEAYNNEKLFNYLRPLPNDTWNYEWCVDNWGTKWDINANGDTVDVDQFAADGGGTLIFDTAWAPGIQAYEAAEDQGFELTAYYHEFGMQFVGRYSNGDDDCYEYGKMSIAELKETLPTDIDEMFDLISDVESSRLNELEESSENHPEESKD